MNDVRFVKDGVARALRTLRAATSPEPGDRVVPLSGADDRVAVHGRGGGSRRREPRHRTLRARRTGVGANRPRRVDHRRNAGRKLEDFEDGGALLRRGYRRARCCRALSVNHCPPPTFTYAWDPSRHVPSRSAYSAGASLTLASQAVHHVLPCF